MSMELERTEDLLPIGAFGRLSGLTVKALRHYDQIGLLVPARVDEASGYRYYTLAQARTAEAVRRLRELAVPLDEVRSMVHAAPDELRELLAVHRSRIEGQAVETRRILTELGRIIDGKESLVPDTREAEAGSAIDIREVEEQRVVAIHDRVTQATIGQAIPEAIGRVHQFLVSHGLEAAGAPLCVCPPPDDDDGTMEIDTGIPVAVELEVEVEPPLVAMTLPATRALVMRHVGPYETLSSSYRLLCETMEERRLRAAGAPWEVYLTDPDEVPDPADYVTEVVWPVEAQDS